jgi:hypothetical protein
MPVGDSGGESAKTNDECGMMKRAAVGGWNAVGQSGLAFSGEEGAYGNCSRRDAGNAEKTIEGSPVLAENMGGELVLRIRVTGIWDLGSEI